MQPGSRPSGRERPIRVADVEGSSPASTVLDSGIEGKAVLPIWSSRIRHQPGMEGTAAWEAAHTLSLHVHYMACDGAEVSGTRCMSCGQTEQPVGGRLDFRLRRSRPQNRTNLL